MLQISDPSNAVYYIEDVTDPNCRVLDPMLPFSTEDEAVKYAIDVMKLSVLNFIIMKWNVE
jgi:Zn-finger domain-containing protein